MNRKIALLINLFLLLSLFSSPTQADESDLIWSTFLGGSSEDEGLGIAVDDSGYVYVTGGTRSEDFPTTAGAFDRTYNGGGYAGGDAFVAKLNPAGSALVYAAFLGGNADDYGRGIAVDGSGSAYVTGQTWSGDFPTTDGAFDETLDGDTDIFVVKMNTAGSALGYSTFLGGDATDCGYDIALDGSGSAYLTGFTQSSDFPTTTGAFDGTHNYYRDVFVTKIDASGSALDYSTFLGGNNAEDGWSIAVDDLGNAYVTGVTWSEDFPTTPGAFDTSYNYRDVFVAKFTPAGKTLDYCTLLGGNEWDDGWGIAVDGFGNAYVTGSTGSADFPTTTGVFDETHNGNYDAFVVKLNQWGNALSFSTFLGGRSWDGGHGIALDGSGRAYVAGKTLSSNFPTTAGAFDRTQNGNFDVFVARLNSTGTVLDYATFLGGDIWECGYDIAVNDAGYAYVAGKTESPAFPVAGDAFDTSYNGGEWFLAGDVFAAQLSLSEPVSVEFTSLATSAPNTYALSQNYPNPFNASTEIRYQIPSEGHVTLRVLNVLGQDVNTLVDARHEVGEYVLSWDGRDAGGREVASGLYLCRLQAGNATMTIKMALVR